MEIQGNRSTFVHALIRSIISRWKSPKLVPYHYLSLTKKTWAKNQLKISGIKPTSFILHWSDTSVWAFEEERNFFYFAELSCQVVKSWMKEIQNATSGGQKFFERIWAWKFSRGKYQITAYPYAHKNGCDFLMVELTFILFRLRKSIWQAELRCVSQKTSLSLMMTHSTLITILPKLFNYCSKADDMKRTSYHVAASSLSSTISDRFHWVVQPQSREISSYQTAVCPQWSQLSAGCCRTSRKLTYCFSWVEGKFWKVRNIPETLERAIDLPSI